MSEIRAGLSDMIRQLELIEEFTAEGESVFYNSVLRQYAVKHAYEILGEAVKRLPSSFLERHPQIEWRKLAKFRDFLIHRYDAVDERKVWEAVSDASKLKCELMLLLQSLDTDISPPDSPTPAPDARGG
jgi:uncharacterized protein with HEPN domain